MQIETKAFGIVEINEADVLKFTGPILGFEEIHEYVVLHDQTKPGPFFWLQAVGHKEPAFVVAEATNLVADYRPEFSIDDLTSLEVESSEDLKILLIMRIPENVKDISANLKAPVVINAKKGVAKQIVLNDDGYQVRHYLIPQEAGGEAHVGADAKRG